MTQGEVRKLLGGYATNALSAEERRILFQAALEDQELFNALENEDALRELLADPVSREQVRRALARPIEGKRSGFRFRRWVLAVALPAAGAVILIAVMDRANAPRLIAPPVQIASRQLGPQAKERVEAKSLDRLPPAAPVAAPRLAAPPASAPAAGFGSTRATAARLRLGGATRIPDTIRQQFASGFDLNAPLYQGPLVRYSLVRSGPAGDRISVQVTSAMAGYLALYEVDAAGNLKRIYPASDPASPVAAGLTVEIPDSPIKMAATSQRLRLVVVPANSPAVVDRLGGSAVNKEAPLFQAPATPLVVDIPLAPN
jgi:hypothetical protein